MQIIDLAIAVLSSIAASAPLSLALIFLLRGWISKRLHQSIAHE
jgi:hypothetical protein